MSDNETLEHGHIQAMYTPTVVPFAGNTNYILYSFCEAHMECQAHMEIEVRLWKRDEVVSSVELLLFHLREHLIGLRLCFVR